jgi:hypothetical protein
VNCKKRGEEQETDSRSTPKKTSQGNYPQHILEIPQLEEQMIMLASKISCMVEAISEGNEAWSEIV